MVGVFLFTKGSLKKVQKPHDMRRQNKTVREILWVADNKIGCVFQ